MQEQEQAYESKLQSLRSQLKLEIQCQDMRLADLEANLDATMASMTQSDYNVTHADPGVVVVEKEQTSFMAADPVGGLSLSAESPDVDGGNSSRGSSGPRNSSQKQESCPHNSSQQQDSRPDDGLIPICEIFGKDDDLPVLRRPADDGGVFQARLDEYFDNMQRRLQAVMGAGDLDSATINAATEDVTLETEPALGADQYLFNSAVQVRPL